MIIIILLITGVIIGSFLTTIIYRVPKMLANYNINLIQPSRSFCPNCKKTINYINLIPIFSYLRNNRCQYCQQKIDITYFLIELISGISTIVIYLIIGFNIELIYFLMLNYALIILFVMDYKYLLVPNIITIPIIWLGLLYNLYFGNIHAAVVGAIVAYISLWLIFWLFKIITNKDGLGYGDFTLFSIFGAWFGWQILPKILLISSLIGIIFYLIKVKNPAKVFAFAPCMITALLLILWFNKIYLQ